MRCFVAAELPAERAGALALWAASATRRDPALRLLAIDSLHLTLAFIGSLARENVGVVEDALADAVAALPWPGALSLGEPLWLSPRRPHVLTVAILDSDGALGVLQAQIAGALSSAIGLQPESRAYLPHVTVARVGRGRSPRTFDLDPPEQGEAFAPDSVVLMRSTLAPAGAQYEALVRIPGHH